MNKKIVFLSVWFAVLLLVAFAAQGIFAIAADDYKVIKNAVKSPEPSRAGQKNLLWFKILVTGKDGAREKAKITIPVSLVEMMINACPDKKFHVEKGCEIDLRKIWSDLKAAGPMALVEVEDHEETVRIWLE